MTAARYPDSSMHSASTPVQFGCQVVTYGDVNGTIRDARRASQAGFDLVTVPDHLFHPTDADSFLVDPPWEAFSVLGAIAQHTGDAMLFPGVTDSVRRHPTEIAHIIATLDRMTDGRAGLGIGAGEVFNFAQITDIDWSNPFARFVEAVEIIIGLWDSTAAEPFSYDGEFFGVQDAHLGLKPVQQPRPPIWVGGYGPSMRGFTGAVADGWFPWIHTPDQYARDLERIIETATERGRDPDAIDRAVCVPTAIAEDPEDARAVALDRCRTTLALRPALLETMGYEDIAADAPEMYQMAFDADQIAQLERAASRIPDAAVEDATIVGTPDEAIERIDSYREAGVDHLVIIPVGPFDETIEHYAETIMPSFR